MVVVLPVILLVGGGSELVAAAEAPAPPAPSIAAELRPTNVLAPYTERIPGSTISFDMVPVPAGRFLMGSAPTEPEHVDAERPQVEVQIEGFWMGRHEVTWEEFDYWSQGLDQNTSRPELPDPSSPSNAVDATARPSLGYVDLSMGMGHGRRPAAGMSQLSAKLYCRWLSHRTGRYYRLPTEAEWEYACRAGTQTAYSFGDDPAKLGDYAWSETNSDLVAQAVGLKQPNIWGLHDLHGNLAEWVLDAFASRAYPSAGQVPVSEPFSAPTSTNQRIVRGGSFDDPPERLRSAARRSSDQSWQMSDPNLPKSIWWLRDAPFVGFRLVRPARTPTPSEQTAFGLDASQQKQFEEYLKRAAPAP